MRKEELERSRQQRYEELKRQLEQLRQDFMWNFEAARREDDFVRDVTYLETVYGPREENLQQLEDALGEAAETTPACTELASPPVYAKSTTTTDRSRASARQVHFAEEESYEELFGVSAPALVGVSPWAYRTPMPMEWATRQLRKEDVSGCSNDSNGSSCGSFVSSSSDSNRSSCDRFDSTSRDSSSKISNNCAMEPEGEIVTLYVEVEEGGNKRKHAQLEEEELGMLKTWEQPREDTYVRVEDPAFKRMMFDRGKEASAGVDEDGLGIPEARGLRGGLSSDNPLYGVELPEQTTNQYL
eukprot:scaffold89125_cov17-Tisochrysis_lutea.AAC.1